MNSAFASRVGVEVNEIKDAGLFKTERIITSEQGAEITVNGKQVLNFCANNYLVCLHTQKCWKLQNIILMSEVSV